jgi:hypothetical protein
MLFTKRMNDITLKASEEPFADFLLHELFITSNRSIYLRVREYLHSFKSSVGNYFATCIRYGITGISCSRCAQF